MEKRDLKKKKRGQENNNSKNNSKASIKPLLNRGKLN